MSNVIFTDGIANIHLANGNLRMLLSKINSQGQAELAGEVIIPANQTVNFINILTQSVNEISEKMKEQSTAKDDVGNNDQKGVGDDKAPDKKTLN